MSDKLIISMTSYPARIHCVKQVFDSILIQNVNRDIYKCVLVLSETEFLNRENDLPQDLLDMINNGDIELLWHPRNIMSHKKLIPTLLKYPSNPILIIDDDICREEGWLQMFIDDHKKYPNDIIVGTFMYHLNDEFKFNRFDGLKGVNCGTLQNIPNMIFDFARPANGAGGVLYPPNTFTDKRFFDEDKFMELTPTSDESWQYLFNILEDRTLRQSSKIFDNSKGVIRGTQGKINCLYKQNNYNEIFKKLFENFPEFKQKLYERQNNKVILSLTSYGERLKNKIADIVINSLLNQTHKPYKICLTLYQDDLKYMSDNLKQLVDNNVIELIISNEDIGPHKKYFYVMQKYRNYPIITFDDDIVYDSDIVESLVKSYKKHPNCISARRVHMITYDNKGCVNKYKQWKYEYKYETSPNKDLFATGGGGTLYPPDILNINDRLLSQIYNMWHVDDIFLKYVELQKGINVVWVKNDRVMCEPIKNEITTSTALYKINCTKNNNDNYIHMLNNSNSSISSNDKNKINHTLSTLNKFLLCAMCKLENHYLGEWITHHLNIGFDKIVLIDNNDTEGEFAENIYDVPEVKDGVERGVIEIVPLNNGKYLQQIQYMKVYERYKYDYDWFCFLDIDEFLMLDRHKNIRHFVNQDKFNNFNAIRLCWKCFDDNDLIEVVDNNYNVKARFTRMSDCPDVTMVKTIFRSFKDEEILIPNPHSVMAVSLRSCNSIGEELSLGQKPNISIMATSLEDAYIAHYPTKTLQEYLETKIKRGGSAQSLEALKSKYNLDYFFRYNRDSEDKRNYLISRNIKYTAPHSHNIFFKNHLQYKILAKP